jgi:hypothetical protein
MPTVDFVPSKWLEQSAFATSYGSCLVCYSRPVQVERRATIRRSADRVEKALLSLLPAQS